MIAAYVGEGAESSGDDDIALNVLEQQVDLLNANGSIAGQNACDHREPPCFTPASEVLFSEIYIRRSGETSTRCRGTQPTFSLNGDSGHLPRIQAGRRVKRVGPVYPSEII